MILCKRLVTDNTSVFDAAKTLFSSAGYDSSDLEVAIKSIYKLSRVSGL